MSRDSLRMPANMLEASPWSLWVVNWSGEMLSWLGFSMVRIQRSAAAVAGMATMA